MNIDTFRVSFFCIKNQCYLITKQSSGILVDPAWDYGVIHQFLEEHRIVLKGILLTHTHIDHTNLANKFSKRYNIPVFMGNIEIDYYTFSCHNLHKAYHLQQLQIDEFTITPIHTPGHTVGSVCYLTDQHLFSGDTVFIEGVGRCRDAEAMFDSIQFLKRFLYGNTKIWPGHSFGQLPGKDLNYLLENNIYFQFTNKQQFVAFRTRKNQPGPFNFK